MNEWFNSLERREQWLVIVGGVCVTFYLLYLLILAPLNKKIELLEVRNQGASETLEWMKQSVAELNSLRGSTKSTSTGGLELSKMVDQSAARHGVRVTRFQPSGDDEAQVWLDKAEFNKLVAWLDQMENAYGVSIKNISMNAGNNPGIVNVRVRFKKGA
jgi:general secretion pathway protein M